MNPSHLITKKRRPAFTLIELLVVIAIIAILVGLLMAAVMAVRNMGPTVQNRNDLLQLQQGLQKFKGEYGRYPPSQIRLRANLQEYTTKRLDTLDDASISFLSVMFKSLSGATSIQWAGPNVNFGTTYPNGVVLEGDQCLVFFLGGPPVGVGQPGLMGGFSVNSADPVYLPGYVSKTPPVDRKRSLDFDAGRLYYRGASPFPSYKDAYGTLPFVYFSSNNRVNGYDKTANSLGVFPYCSQTTPTLKFYNPDSFQLISAGADGVQANGGFGRGGVWPVTAAWNSAQKYDVLDGVTFNGVSYVCILANSNTSPVVNADSNFWVRNLYGKDDVSNFYDKVLGAQ